jgi:signal transduction histidine kinase
MNKPSGVEIRKLFRNPHFWITIAISLALVFVYHSWPWREWQFSHGILRQFAWLSSLYPLALWEIQHRLIGSLFFIPIIYASISTLWRGGLFMTLFSLLGLTPILASMIIDRLLSNISLLLLPIAVVLVIKIEFELRSKERRIYIDRERDRQVYLKKILETQEKERQRLAGELHDQSVQTLLAVASYAESMESLNFSNAEEIRTKAELIKEKTRGTVDDLRRICVNLRPSILDHMGLISALKWLANRTTKESRIQVNLKIGSIKPELSPVVEVNLFRIAQEALHNIERHSKATEVFLTLENGQGGLTMTIQDNGQGFILPDKFGELVNHGKLGLIGMQERVRTLEGKFNINSKLGEGTLIQIEIPASMISPSEQL